MAEFVQHNIEEMLPELEQMERVKLFTKAETRTILRKRKGFEYKLKRKTKEKNDFLNYIQYENNLLSLVRKRRENSGYTFKRMEIDLAIIQRIHRLFRVAIYRFQEDVKLWLSHIQFCKQRGEKNSVSKMFTRMLQVHNRNPGLWVLAAKWEFEDIKSADNARSLLQRGLRFNPKSKELWLEYYRMELLYTDKIRKRRHILGVREEEDEHSADVVYEGKIAPIVYKNAIETFPADVDFHLSFLPICQLFDFTKQHQDEIYKDLEYHHSDKEMTWDALARRELREEKNMEEAVIEKMESKCFQVFQTAVQRLPTERMWSLYLTACLSRLETKASNEFMQKRICRCLETFTEAQNSGLVSEAMFLEWVNLLTNIAHLKEADSVLEKATLKHPKSVSLWTKHLQLTMVQDKGSEAVHQVFSDAVKAVKQKKSLPLWQLMVEWGLAVQDDMLEEVFKRGCAWCREVAVPLKEWYLDWTAVTNGVNAAREVYQSQSACQPLSVDFFRKYIDIESAQPKPKMKKLRTAFEDAIREYGTTDCDLWLDYIRLELSHRKGVPDNASKLHWRAVKTLDGELTEAFIAQYTLLQTGHTT